MERTPLLPERNPRDPEPPSPPPSPRKRRRELRESEETWGHMSIEDFLLRMDAFRSTTEPSPLPYPLREEPGPEDVRQRVEGIFPDIDRLLHARRIRQYSLRVDNVSKPAYPGGDQPVPTVRVLIWEDFSGSFGTIKDEIRNLLSSDNIPIE